MLKQVETKWCARLLTSTEKSVMRIQCTFEALWLEADLHSGTDFRRETVRSVCAHCISGPFREKLLILPGMKLAWKRDEII